MGHDFARYASNSSNHVSTMILSDGTTCLVEPPQREGSDRRVFRECGAGWEWAHWREVASYGPRARWYGYASRELPETMTAL